ncbi:MAG: hypothetical protein ABIO43_04245 [Sphingomicrobium sp.]
MEVPQTSPETLIKASAGAAIAAAAVLGLFVLPAEAGIDPTGVGSALGLTRMSASGGETSSPAPDMAAVPAVSASEVPDKVAILKTGPMRTDEMTLRLAPDEGAEIKAHMKAGDHFVFRWDVKGGPVKLDMHGERPNSGEFSSYWEESGLTEGQGSFTAPFAGTHGWYWRNRGEKPVTVTVKTTGFYQDLFRPTHG